MDQLYQSSPNGLPSSLQQPQTKQVIKTLLYSDIFNYPLTASEITQHHLQTSATEQEVDGILQELCTQGILVQRDFFYSVRPEIDLQRDRLDKNQLAKKYLKRGQNISRFISRFPFVRGVFLSGSISKDCMVKDGDIDYFIITAPERLWIARTLLILFKKIFLLNSYKFFCLNYFVDTDHLEIADKNIYTATEIVTLIPTFGKSVCREFLDANTWAREFRPNFPNRSFDQVPKNQIGPLKGFAEWMLSGFIGKSLNTFFLKVTASFWKRKFRSFAQEDYDQAIRSKDHISKIHPENFQKKVLLEYNARITEFETKYSVSLM